MTGHLKLEWAERKAFCKEQLGEQVRSSVKRMLEQALEAEQTARLAVGRYVWDVGHSSFSSGKDATVDTERGGTSGTVPSILVLDGWFSREYRFLG